MQGIGCHRAFPSKKEFQSGACQMFAVDKWGFQRALHWIKVSLYTVSITVCTTKSKNEARESKPSTSASRHKMSCQKTSTGKPEDVASAVRILRKWHLQHKLYTCTVNPHGVSHLCLYKHLRSLYMLHPAFAQFAISCKHKGGNK